MSRIRVVLADDHTVLREGLAALLGDQADIDVVAEASDGAGAVRSALAQRPDVVLMDISMPGMDGIEATRRLRSELPEAQVLALTMHDEEAFFFHMLQAGAAGYLLKGASSEELIEAIHVVHSGGIYLNPAMARRLMDDYLHRVPAEQSELDLLTPREREVLTLLADGLTNREVADRLVITLNTVATHRRHVMDKLGLRNKSQLIKYALRKGLISLDT